MGFSVRGRGGAWQSASFIAHAWSVLWKKDAGRLFGKKMRAVCSSMGGLHGGDDEAAESGAEMVVRLGVLRRRGIVAEMPAVLVARAGPTGKGAKMDILAQRWTKWHESGQFGRDGGTGTEIATFRVKTFKSDLQKHKTPTDRKQRKIV